MIETTHIYPPIPIRNFDWEATRSDYDEGDPIGYGKTEDEAIQNLLELEA
jgi:hypothetical protein